MVIARFDLRSLVVMETVILGVVFAVWWIIVRDVPDQNGMPPLQNPGSWFVAAGTPFALAYALVLAWHGLFRRGRAIWIEGGALHSLPLTLGGSTPLRDIVGVSKGKYRNRYWLSSDCIDVEIVGHKCIQMQTWCLSEPRDAIMERLNLALADSRR